MSVFLHASMGASMMECTLAVLSVLAKRSHPIYPKILPAGLQDDFIDKSTRLWNDCDDVEYADTPTYGT